MSKEIEFRAIIPPIMSAIRTGGDGMRVSFDIPESDVQNAAALIALRNCSLVITVHVDTNPTATKTEKPKRETKAKEPKGEHGLYWQEMYKRGVFNFPDLIEVLPMDEGDFHHNPMGVKECLKASFEVDSLTFISPFDFEQWCETQNLYTLINMSRQAAVKAAEKVTA